MTGSVHPTLDGPALLAQRARWLWLTSTAALVAAGICLGAPLLAIWVGSRVQLETAPSMSSIAVAVVVLAAVTYALAALLRRLDLAQAQMSGTPLTGRGGMPWLHGAGRALRPPGAMSRRPACQVESSATEAPREPLVLIDGSCGADRPWELAISHLEFGFEILAGVLPRDGSILGAERAMDRLGWTTAHVVARPCDVRAAVELARRGRARSLHILAADPVGRDPVETATEIADFVAFRPVA